MPERRDNYADVLSEVNLSSNVSNQCSKKLLSLSKILQIFKKHYVRLKLFSFLFIPSTLFSWLSPHHFLSNFLLSGTIRYSSFILYFLSPTLAFLQIGLVPLLGNGILKPRSECQVCSLLLGYHCTCIHINVAVMGHVSLNIK